MRSNNLLGNFFTIYVNLTAPLRGKVIVNIFLMIISAMLEFLGLSAIVPFLGSLIAPSSNYKFSFASFSIEIDSHNFYFLVATFFVLFLLSAGFRLLTLRFSFVLAGNIGHELSTLSFERYIKQSYLKIVSTNSSDLVSTLTHSMDRTVRSCVALFNMITTFVIVLFIVAALLIIDYKLSLLIITVVALIYFMLARLSRSKLVRNSKIATSSISNQILIINESLGSIKEIIFSQAQQSQVLKYSLVDKTLRDSQANNAYMTASPKFIIEPVALLLIFSIITLNSRLDGSFSASLPTLAAVLFGFQKILPSTQQFYVSWSTIKSFHQDINKVIHLLHLEPDKSRLNGLAKTIDPLIPFSSIQINDLCFSYPDQKGFQIDKINLSIPFGSKLGIIGTSGSGKSTFVDLLLTILQPTSGSVSLEFETNNTSTRHISMLNYISYVPQVPYINDSSLLENITGQGDLIDVNLDKLNFALNVAHLDGLVSTFDEGLFFNVGENGCNLSGGQLQRISIARAVYKLNDKSPVLILDEATSALDVITESLIVDKLTNIKGLTLISIAHRLKSLCTMNLILELSEGKIARFISQDQFNDELSDFVYSKKP